MSFLYVGRGDGKGSFIISKYILILFFIFAMLLLSAGNVFAQTGVGGDVGGGGGGTGGPSDVGGGDTGTVCDINPSYSETISCTTSQECSGTTTWTCATQAWSTCADVPNDGCPAPVACYSNTDCNDFAICTTDTCVNPGTSSAYCSNVVSGVHLECQGNACVSVANTITSCTNTCSTGADCGACTPATEVCDGIDNDCDNLVDEGSLCPSGQTCSGGMCITSIITCTNECSTNSCVGTNSYQVCGNFDGDSCLEYGPITSCPSRQTCSAGVCVTLPPSPFSITSVTSTCPGPNNVITWQRSSGATSYDVYSCSTTPDSSCFPRTLIAGGLRTTSFTHQNVALNTKYRYRVTAKN